MLSFSHGVIGWQTYEEKNMTQMGFRDGVVTVKKLEVKDKVVMQYIIPKTVAVSTTALLNGKNFNATGTAAVLNTGLLIQPPYPMSLSVQAVAAGTAANTDALTFVGYNAKGKRVSESVVVSSTAAAITYTNNAFSRITSITPNRTIKSTDVNIGYRAVVGLPWPIADDSDILSYAYDGAYATSAATSMTIDATYDTLTLPAMAATKVVSVVYLTKLQD